MQIFKTFTVKYNVFWLSYKCTSLRREIYHLILDFCLNITILVRCTNVTTATMLIFKMASVHLAIYAVGKLLIVILSLGHVFFRRRTIKVFHISGIVGAEHRWGVPGGTMAFQLERMVFCSPIFCNFAIGGPQPDYLGDLGMENWETPA